MSLPRARYANDSALVRFYAQLIERVGATARRALGRAGVAACRSSSDGMNQNPFYVEGDARRRDEDSAAADLHDDRRRLLSRDGDSADRRPRRSIAIGVAARLRSDHQPSDRRAILEGPHRQVGARQAFPQSAGRSVGHDRRRRRERARHRARRAAVADGVFPACRRRTTRSIRRRSARWRSS